MTYRILLLGQSGSGKSSFINALFGETRAEVKDYEACTKEIAEYKHISRYGKIIIYDTPGFSQGKDKELINQIRNVISKLEFDKILYFTHIHATRLRQSEKRTIIELFSFLPKKYQKRTWILYSFGNYVDNCLGMAENRSIYIKKIIDSVSEIENPIKNRIAIIDSNHFRWWDSKYKNTYSICKFLTCRRNYRQQPVYIRASRKIKEHE